MLNIEEQYQERKLMFLGDNKKALMGFFICRKIGQKIATFIGGKEILV